MTIAHPYGGVPLTGADALDHVKANALADGLVLAPDAVNGGTYALSGAADLEFVGGTKKVRFDKLELEGTTKVLLESRSLTRFASAAEAVSSTKTYAGSNSPVQQWALETSLAGFNLQDNRYDHTGAVDTTSTASVAFRLHIPDGATLTSVKVYFKPGVSHGSLPANFPTLSVWKVSINSSVGTQIGSTTTDTAASVVAYEVERSLTVGSLSEVADNDGKIYWAGFTTEYGANAKIGGLIHGIEYTFTTTAMDDGAA